jgi:hypothetical protein
MSRPDHVEIDDGECWQCGGEGRVAGTCIDGCCLEQDDPDCPYCSRRCDICNPRKIAIAALAPEQEK